MKVVHEPFATDCKKCHDPHGGDNRLFVKGGLGGGNCRECHSDVVKNVKYIHGPVGAEECLVCHTAHQSEHKGLLAQPAQQLCQNCHTDIEQQVKAGISVHKPVVEDCMACHKPHGSNVPVLLTAETQDLCEKCHDEVLKTNRTMKHPHAPMMEGKACSHCHLPHAANQEKLLAANNKQLCLNCHGQAIQAGARTIRNISAELEGATFTHGPIRQDNCIACHKAHGSDFKNILEYNFPENFYASFEDKTYQLCFHCHDPKLIVEERTGTTGFRNGDQNLHFIHVKRQKGRSCRACHNEHASEQSHHIRNEVAFGKWMMPVKFEKSASGGTCMTGCHQPYRYDRENRVENKRMAQ